MTSTGAKTAALAVLDLARAGRFADIRDRFAASLRPMIAAAALQAAWDAEVARLGPVVSAGDPVSETADTRVVLVRVPVRFERGQLTLLVSVIPSGELAGLQLAPADAAEPPAPWPPPPYADPDRFDEQEVMLGEGPLAVPGTLTRPTAAGPRPGVVLLGGSGPTDRDSTIAHNKPFKDLAWGLASRGVAVLRFDKVTLVHPDQVRADRDFTVADEYLPHALAALRLLRAHPAVDAGKVFLAGHSLGGTIAPRVAAADSSVAGVVILAGGSEPLHWAVVRQVRYLASLDPATTTAAHSVIDAMTAQAEQVDSPDLSPDTPDDRLPFGAPAPYWLHLRDYDPVATAAALRQPLFIGQGGRDYQATVADDLARWQAGLHGRRDVTTRVYPADNHFFFPGAGPSSPAELNRPQHLDPQLVADLDAWLTSQAAS
jgi:predicted alpha/beta-hydrolase family hydrolase